MIPGSLDLLLPLLRLAAQQPWERFALIETLSDAFALTQEERQKLAGAGNTTRTQMNLNAGQARQDLHKAKLVDYPPTKGMWVVASEKGQQFLQDHADRDDAFLTTLLIQTVGRKDPAVPLSKASKNTPEPQCTPAPLLPPFPVKVEEMVQKTLSPFWHTQDEILTVVLHYVHAQPPVFFEKLSLELVKQMKLSEWSHLGQVTGGASDGGIDAIIPLDAVGFSNIGIQCKRYQPKKKVSASDMQKFKGGLDNIQAEKGIFLTTSEFSAQARIQAQTTKTYTIKLINGQQLGRFLLHFQMGVRKDTQTGLYQLAPDTFFSKTSS